MGDQEQVIRLELLKKDVEETIADEILYSNDWQSMLFDACKKLYKQKYIGQTYPQEEIETKILNLTKMISIEKNLKITLGEQVSEFFWQEFLNSLQMDYAQLVWTKVFKRTEATERVYYFSFVPVALQTTGFPFNFHLEESLSQQFIPGETHELVTNWENQLLSSIEDYISTKLIIPDLQLSEVDEEQEQVQRELEMLRLEFEPEDQTSEWSERPVDSTLENLILPEYEEEASTEQSEALVLSDNDEEYTEILAILDRIETQTEEHDPLEILETEDDNDQSQTEDSTNEGHVAKDRSRATRRNRQANRKKAKAKKKKKTDELPEKLIVDEEIDWDSINELAELADSKQKENYEVSLSEDTSLQVMEQEELVNRVRYLEEEIKRANDSKARVLVANERLEHDNQRLERQLLDYRLRWLEDEPTYHKRTSDWYKKIKIEVSEYDELIQKARLLEHIWKINQQLIGTTEKLTIKDQHHTYEFERVQQIKNSAKDLELFVMMDECRNINERVKIRHGFLFIPARAIIQKRDYDNLLEKAAYFDMMQAENQLLEKMISSHEKKLEEKEMKKVKSVEVKKD